MNYEEFTYFGKPVEEMTIEELMAERDVQSWAANRMADAAFIQTKKLAHLQSEEPLPDEADLEKMYEDGQITRQERNEIRRTIRKRKYDHAKAERAIVFGQMAEANFKAVRVKCSEQIELIRGDQKHAVRGKKPTPHKPPRYDPRRGKVRENMYAPVAPIIAYVTKWNRIKQARNDFDKQLQKVDPIKNWDYDRLLYIANSRGYMSRPTLEAAVAQELGITMHSASVMLKEGKMTWQHITTIGAILEMTPAEFCDVFLYDYFKEVVDGKWIADK